VVCVVNGMIKNIAVRQSGRSNSHVRVMPELLMLTITEHIIINLTLSEHRKVLSYELLLVIRNIMGS